MTNPNPTDSLEPRDERNSDDILADAGVERSKPAIETEADDEGHTTSAGVATGADSTPPAVQFADVISGVFDADETRTDLPPPKRVLAPQVDTPKLHKVLAQAGLGSRLEMEQLITEGRISVNNEPAHIGQRVQFGDQVKVNGSCRG
jgi:23S rRNA pseudouridine2605 synthase